MSSTCRSCGEPIIWAKSAKTGANIPLDLEPVLGGNLFLADGRVTVMAPDQDVIRYVSHFTTCPNADQHRRKG